MVSTIGDIRRATEIIKKYYLRVINANRYFTDIQPGWQTDRGLIYIVQGQPNYIYRTYNTEVWLYGSRDEMYSKVIIFIVQKFQIIFSHGNFLETLIINHFGFIM